MTLRSKHRIRNSSSGGLRPSTLPIGNGGSQQYWIFMSQRGRNISFLWNLGRPEWSSKPRSPTFQAGSFNHCIRVPAMALYITCTGSLVINPLFVKLSARASYYVMMIKLIGRQAFIGQSIYRCLSPPVINAHWLRRYSRACHERTSTQRVDHLSARHRNHTLTLNLLARP